MAKKSMIIQPLRGEIYLVSFNPTIGAEIQKTRPATILQNDIANEYSPMTIVPTITSQFEDKLYPTEVLIQSPEGGLTINSVVLLNQIRSLDKKRLVKRLGKLTDETMMLIDRAIQISLGLVK
jgi:mRNA interferase MazF